MPSIPQKNLGITAILDLQYWTSILKLLLETHERIRSQFSPTSRLFHFRRVIDQVHFGVGKGDVDTPKGRKGKRTSRTVGLSPGTVADLKVWQTMLLQVGPEAYLFPSERETPLRRDNVWKRDMQPKLKPVGLGWATFQVLRRTNASLSRKAKIDDKVAADQRGHGLGVSLEVYSISGVQQKIDAAKRLESEVIQ